ncbi:hypothetical protein BAR24066_04992 [Burkholderia arboris]|uniref:Uncharacterized protein n=1 Tax=Burkholderia arboris TaxID=488730 RepID=A0A9Q9SM74_9BURK|nr:hypothetical protein BAR24066_04992 [Burkholderia arboris]
MHVALGVRVDSFIDNLTEIMSSLRLCPKQSRQFASYAPPPDRRAMIYMRFVVCESFGGGAAPGLRPGGVYSRWRLGCYGRLPEFTSGLNGTAPSSPSGQLSPITMGRSQCMFDNQDWIGNNSSVKSTRKPLRAIYHPSCASTVSFARFGQSKRFFLKSPNLVQLVGTGYRSSVFWKISGASGCRKSRSVFYSAFLNDSPIVMGRECSGALFTGSRVLTFLMNRSWQSRSRNARLTWAT